MHRRWSGSGRVVLPGVIVHRSSAGAPPGGRVLVLGVLCVVAAVNLIDRQLITILAWIRSNANFTPAIR